MPETAEIENYQFPEGIRFKDFGDGCICVPKFDSSGSYLKTLLCVITDGTYESTLEITSLGTSLTPLRLLKSELDNALDTFLKGRAALETN